ncbi:hypothetical protein F4777DRAFT_6969 [Nemania sp. FL0916]|nr:hypothetical protein F4777DRAFT_6969 [Nemania sp. FL0916]
MTHSDSRRRRTQAQHRNARRPQRAHSQHAHANGDGLAEQLPDGNALGDQYSDQADFDDSDATVGLGTNGRASIFRPSYGLVPSPDVVDSGDPVSYCLSDNAPSWQETYQHGQPQVPTSPVDYPQTDGPSTGYHRLTFLDTQPVQAPEYQYDMSGPAPAPAPQDWLAGEDIVQAWMSSPSSTRARQGSDASGADVDPGGYATLAESGTEAAGDEYHDGGGSTGENTLVHRDQYVRECIDDPVLPWSPEFPRQNPH